MAQRPARFFFARINLIAQYEDKATFLWDGLNAPAISESRAYNWGFSRIDRAEVGGRLFFFGYLLKYRPSTDEPVFDEETHDVRTEPIENRVAAQSLFFLDVASGMLAYHPVGGQIETTGFSSQFSRLIQDAYENLLIRVDIVPIGDRYEIMEEVRAFDRVTRVIVRLHPANPSAGRDWKKTQERLKRLDAGGSLTASPRVRRHPPRPRKPCRAPRFAAGHPRKWCLPAALVPAVGVARNSLPRTLRSERQ